MQYALGAHRSPPDARDFAASAFQPATLPPLPPELDLRPCLQPVRQQGSEGTCAAHAGASGVGGYDETTHVPSLGRVLSVRWLYEHARTLMPVPGGAEGAYLRAIMAVMLSPGVCLEQDQPYIAGVSTPAGPDAAAHAAQNRLGSYASVDLMVPSVKAAMFMHGPIATATDVDDGFCSPGTANGRRIIIPGGAKHGGHAFCLVGWRDDIQCWLIRNSWGPEWADGGYAWLPWSYPLWEAWASTPALVDGQPVVVDTPWWDRVFPWLRGLGL